MPARSHHYLGGIQPDHPGVEGFRPASGSGSECAIAVSPAAVAKFLADAFAGAIRAWLGDPSVSKGDLVAAAVACAPACWAAVADPSR